MHMSGSKDRELTKGRTCDTIQKKEHMFCKKEGLDVSELEYEFNKKW